MFTQNGFSAASLNLSANGLRSTEANADEEIKPVKFYIGGIIGNMRTRETMKLRIIREKYGSCPGSCEKGVLFGKLPDGGEFSLSCPYMTSKCAFAQRQWSRLQNVFFDACKTTAIPPIHAKNLPKPQMTQAVMAVDKWDSQKHPILLLLGERGVGKSFAAAYAFCRWIRKQLPYDLWKEKEEWRFLNDDVAKSLCWMHVYELTNDRDAPKQAANAPFLVIDDLATEDATPATKSRINYVISKRYDTQRATVITCNLNEDEFQKQYGERIFDRIQYAGSIANIKDENLRIFGEFHD